MTDLPLADQATEEITTAEHPLTLFCSWLHTAEGSEPNDPNAMALATVGPDGMPSVRMVLLKDFDQRGFVFYTNLESQKGEDLTCNPNASLCFHWKSIRRQVRIDGVVKRVEDTESDAYFRTRPRGSQLGAWASRQSRPLSSRADLIAAVVRYAAVYAFREVPRPPYWSGFRVIPHRIEFWHDRFFRLHERLVFIRDTRGWQTKKLFP
jgi:pyridoxamine 5'-phosphate oxidase